MKRVFSFNFTNRGEQKLHFFVRTKPFRPENVLTIGPITVTLQFPLTKYFILVFRYLNF